MINKMPNIQETHEFALNYLLKYRETHPDFTFPMRKNNNNDRLTQGYWFRGNDNYISIGLFKKSDGKANIYSIHYYNNIKQNKRYIEVIFPNIENIAQADADFHKGLINKYPGFEQQSSGILYKWYLTDGLEQDLKFYMTDFRDSCIELLLEHGLDSNGSYIISQQEFATNLDRINKYRNDADSDDEDEEENDEEQVNKLPFGLNVNEPNIIFYGPPGTGKTYRLNKLKEFFQTTAKTEDEKIRELFKKYPLWQVLVLILRDMDGQQKVPDIKQHRYLNLIKSVSKDRSRMVWGDLQYHAPKESETVHAKRQLNPAVFDKTEDSKWFLLENHEEICEDFIEEFEQIKAAHIESQINRYKFITFHQNYGYEDFIEGLKAKSEDGDISYEIEDGIFKQICADAANDTNSNYAIFIDEINRGNIAKIFGELITLIEASKRTGQDDEVKTILPYSNEEFSVPPNLFIIGTMNTADRSIMLLDTALRRRFTFIEMMPDYDELKEIIDGINIKDMLIHINQRIEYLYDRDHVIGHSYLMSCKTINDLEKAFRNKIIPLLQEYFYNDWEKINLIFNNNDFITGKKMADKLFHDSINLDKKTYKVADAGGNNPFLIAAEYIKIYQNNE